MKREEETETGALFQNLACSYADNILGSIGDKSVLKDRHLN